jgi:hypothetical protein
MQLHHWVMAWVLSALLASAAGAQTRAKVDADLLHTLKARQLLADDPELAATNIGVTVTNRVAVLWGPVPSAEVRHRAELTVRTMIELTQVRNELFLNELVRPVRIPLRIETPPLRLPDMAPPKLPREVRPLFGAPPLGQAKTESKKLPINVLPPEALDAPVELIKPVR